MYVNPARSEKYCKNHIWKYVSLLWVATLFKKYWWCVAKRLKGSFIATSLSIRYKKHQKPIFFQSNQLLCPQKDSSPANIYNRKGNPLANVN